MNPRESLISFPTNSSPMPKKWRTFRCFPDTGFLCRTSGQIGISLAGGQDLQNKEADWLKKDKLLLSSYRKAASSMPSVAGPVTRRMVRPSQYGAHARRKRLGHRRCEPFDRGCDARTDGPIKINGKPVEGVPPMPAHGFMKDDQLASILTHVRNAWGNRADRFPIRTSAVYRKAQADRVVPWTESEF